MLVSHRKRFIYTKTVKTGGTSVEAYFEPWCMPEGTWEPRHHRDTCVTEAGIVGFRGMQRSPEETWYNHMPAAVIRAQVGEDIWNSYFKFCVVRSPFERAVSAFYFMRRIHPDALDASLPEPVQLELFLERGGLINDRDKYLIGPRFCLDDVIRHESMDEDMRRVCARIDVPWEPERLPDYKKGIRPPHATVKALFTERSRRLIETLWAPELQTFGYRFPE